MLRRTLVAGLCVAALAPADAAAQQVTSTAYCLQGRMADGTFVRSGSVANNMYALGTKITARPGFGGQTQFVVRDRIGHGTQLDFWTPSCAAAIAYGRRTQVITLGWTPRKNHWKGLAREAVRCGLLCGAGPHRALRSNPQKVRQVVKPAQHRPTCPLARLDCHLPPLR